MANNKKADGEPEYYGGKRNAILKAGSDGLFIIRKRKRGTREYETIRIAQVSAKNKEEAKRKFIRKRGDNVLLSTIKYTGIESNGHRYYHARLRK